LAHHHLFAEKFEHPAVPEVRRFDRQELAAAAGFAAAAGKATLPDFAKSASAAKQFVHQEPAASQATQKV
jgi:hypothetical protein